VAEAAQHRTVVYDTVLNWTDFDHWLQRLMKAELVALDTETTSLDEMRAEIVGISFSVQPGEAAYIPLAHAGPDAPAQLPRDEVLARLKPWLENGKHHKLGQHVKYDRHVFANHGIEVQGYVHDTMLQSYVLEVHKPHGLEPGRAPHGPHRHQLRRPVRQGRAPDPVRPGAGGQGGRLFVRRLGPDAGRAPGAVAALAGRREAALHLRAGDRQQRGAATASSATAC
jgi:oligoribonuclease (3'-5' exoribonuclease)